MSLRTLFQIKGLITICMMSAVSLIFQRLMIQEKHLLLFAIDARCHAAIGNENFRYRKLAPSAINIGEIF
jgi:hypothetical protein